LSGSVMLARSRVFPDLLALIILGQAVLAVDHSSTVSPSRSFTVPFERH